MKIGLTDYERCAGNRQAALAYQPWDGCDRDLFQATLLASYEDTLDCPELNDARTADDIMAGYRAMPGCRPDCWWLAWHQGRPAGVLLLTEHGSPAQWDLTYLGVVRAARGCGVGRALTQKALDAAHAAGALQMTLTLDARNGPAERLYRDCGFEAFDQRQVYLALFR
jgi:GNAT superfamily N-acetyltransferase